MPAWTLPRFNSRTSAVKNLIITMLSLVFSTALLAEPVLYICERPTWGDDEGCGPNKTRYTYAFVIDSEDFSTKKRNDT